MNRSTLIAGLLLLGLSTSAASLLLHVATNGNDSASGAGTSRAGDGPLATVGAALRKARAAKSADGVTILLHGGVHRLVEPIVLTPEDSGASARQPFTIAAFGMDKPLLSGGVPLRNWKQAVGQPGLWQADARAQLGDNWQFHSLFLNGRRATRARTPNAGELFRMVGSRFNDKPFQFKFRAGDIKPSWAEAGDVEVVAFEKWTDIRQFIRDVNTESNVVTLSGSSSPHTRESGARYFIENAPDAIDVPGEWRLDRNSGVVTAKFKAGENPNSMELVVPRLQELVQFNGDMAGQRAVRHVVLRGLIFADTDWSISSEGYRDTQAAVAVRGEVFGDGMTDCVIEDCTFTRLAGYGIDLGRGCQRNRIVGNEMFDLGAGGVRVGETTVRNGEFDATHSNVITNNIVLFNSGSLLGSTWKNDQFVIDGNLYWDTRSTGNAPKPMFSNATLEQWKARGHDTNSVFADPLFVDAARGDFRLQPDSPAARMGFKPVDLSSVGVRPAERRQ
ncbi:MAG TPA: hypothetical protein VGK40_04425 [Verrucomicrobiae bacterium]